MGGCLRAGYAITSANIPGMSLTKDIAIFALDASFWAAFLDVCACDVQNSAISPCIYSNAASGLSL